MLWELRPRIAIVEYWKAGVIRCCSGKRENAECIDAYCPFFVFLLHTVIALTLGEEGGEGTY